MVTIVFSEKPFTSPPIHRPLTTLCGAEQPEGGGGGFDLHIALIPVPVHCPDSLQVRLALGGSSVVPGPHVRMACMPATKPPNGAGDQAPPKTGDGVAQICGVGGGGAETHLAAVLPLHPPF